LSFCTANALKMNTTSATRAVPNMGFSVFGRIPTGKRKRTQVVNVQDTHYATRFSHWAVS